MTLLDTNIVSELMRSEPDAHVLTWIEDQAPESLWVSAITVAEIHAGVELLPQGKRRSGLRRGFEMFLARGFGGRILPFDSTAAARYGEFVALGSSVGRPIAQLDAQIASIASAHGLAVATRNVRDFDGLALAVVNPFGDS